MDANVIASLLGIVGCVYLRGQGVWWTRGVGSGRMLVARTPRGPVSLIFVWTARSRQGVSPMSSYPRGRRGGRRRSMGSSGEGGKGS